jgi:hypothetical protein
MQVVSPVGYESAKMNLIPVKEFIVVVPFNKVRGNPRTLWVVLDNVVS